MKRRVTKAPEAGRALYLRSLAGLAGMSRTGLVAEPARTPAACHPEPGKGSTVGTRLRISLGYCARLRTTGPDR